MAEAPAKEKLDNKIEKVGAQTKGSASNPDSHQKSDSVINVPVSSHSCTWKKLTYIVCWWKIFIIFQDDDEVDDRDDDEELTDSEDDVLTIDEDEPVNSGGVFNSNEHAYSTGS